MLDVRHPAKAVYADLCDDRIKPAWQTQAITLKHLDHLTKPQVLNNIFLPIAKHPGLMNREVTTGSMLLEGSPNRARSPNVATGRVQKLLSCRIYKINTQGKALRGVSRCMHRCMPACLHRFFFFLFTRTSVFFYPVPLSLSSRPL